MRFDLLAATVATTMLTFAFTQAYAAEYKYLIVDAPKSSNTNLLGINNNGQFVGYSFDGSYVSSFVGGNGVFQKLEMPGIEGFIAQDINDSGYIVGNYFKDGRSHGLINLLGTATFTDVIGASDTHINSINQAGQIVGYYRDISGVHGFIKTGEEIVNVDIPLAGYTTVNAINDKGTIIGDYSRKNPFGGIDFDDAFVKQDNNISVIGGNNFYSIRSYDINDLGQIVGYSYGISNGAFVDSDGNRTLIKMPGAIETYAHGINNLGQVVGTFFDGSRYHGFLATPIVTPTAVSEPASMSIVGLGIFGVGLVRRKRS